MKKIILLLIMMIVSFGAMAQTINDIKFYTEEYPPYNYRGADGRLQGIAIDLLAEILREVGSNRNAQETKLVPWDEVYNNLVKNKNIMGFSTTRSFTREKLFKWAGPIVHSRTIAIGRVGDTRVKDIDDLKNYKIAVIKNDAGHHIGRSIKIPEENFIIATNLDEILQAMESGQADFWIYEESVIQWYLKNKGKVSEYEPKTTLSSNNMSYAFSLDVPDSLVVQFQDAIDTIMSNGMYYDILDRYTK